MDPTPFEYQFPCEATRSCVVKTEESLSGRTTMTKSDRGGSVCLQCSQRGSSTNKVLANSVLRRGPRDRELGARGVHACDRDQHGEREVRQNLSALKEKRPMATEITHQREVRRGNVLARSYDFVVVGAGS